MPCRSTGLGSAFSGAGLPFLYESICLGLDVKAEKVFAEGL